MRIFAVAGDNAALARHHGSLYVWLGEDAVKDFRVEIAFRGYEGLNRSVWAGLGCAVEHVTVETEAPYEFAWAGTSHYLALHDIVLTEGEARLDNRVEQSLLDLTGRLTFAPEGCPISGWSAPARRRNSFTALFIDPELAREEFDGPLKSVPPPELYFRDATLRETLLKLSALLASDQPVDSLHAETLALLAALELHQRRRDAPDAARASRLSRRQETLVEAYIAEHLAQPLTLAELAELVDLSRFHFSRLFAASFGATPLAFVRARRIERAKALLAAPGQSLGEIAEASGFSSAGSLSNAFRKTVGMGPREFRKR